MHSPAGDRYFLSSEKLGAFYTYIGNDCFAPKEGPFPFVKITEQICCMAPWGTMQYANPGDKLVARGREIYAIHSISFAIGYAII